MAGLILGPLRIFTQLAGQLQAGESPFPSQFRARGQGQAHRRASPRFALRHSIVCDENTRRYFNEIAADYCASLGGVYSALLDAAESLISPYLDETFRILDTGCGPGRLAQRLARRVPRGEVAGIDIAETMLEQARQWLIEHRCANVTLTRAAIESFTAETNGIFDCIVCFLSFGFFRDAQKCVERFAQLCAPDGLLFIVEPDQDMYARLWQSQTDLLLDAPQAIRLAPASIAALLTAAGFDPVGIQPVLPGFTALCGLRGAQKKPAVHDRQGKAGSYVR
jgi:ubiquinone/menaquinone biosynthesis C-methylase UbiE